MSTRPEPSADASFAELRAFYEGRRVFVTGHTGFKGSWLTLWLARLGAEVTGFALPPEQGPDNLFDRAGVASACRSRFGDICDAGVVGEAISKARPQSVFHLAARALVQQGYDDPVGMFSVNTVGTACVLEAARRCETVDSVVCVTTDKVYLNREWPWPYRETDELGGLDPYSASKAAAELVTRCYARALRPKGRDLALATARGGNVVGGGDWSPHRLVPDLVRAVRSGEPLRLRYPMATRPWQHVLDLCHAYLRLGRGLALGRVDEPAFNFGPSTQTEPPVSELAARFLETFDRREHPIEHAPGAAYEAGVLRLDASLADQRLGWRPALDISATIDWTAEWYRRYLDDPGAAAAITRDQVERFEQLLEGRTTESDARDTARA
jgi:CDP-glucose 4,6-dehydratase